MGFCLPKYTADILKGKFKSGEITPEKLSDMSSAERRQTLSFLGEENAKNTNALFESKLLLKNQQLGMINWAKQILKLKPDILRDTLTKVEKMTEVLSEKDLEKFKEDLIAKKLGFEVSQEEAGKLVDLAKNVEDLKKPVVEMQSKPDYLERFNNKQETPQELETRIKYGTSLELFKSYVESLKPETTPITFKEFIKTPSKYFENLGNLTKSIVASIDNSFWGNQGITTLLNFRTTDIWVKNFIKSWGDIGRALKGEDPMVGIKADAFSRPDAVNGTYTREKIAIGLHGEEVFPISLPERIPLFGRIFKAASAAYNGAAIRLRVDLADRANISARQAGVDLTDPIRAEAIGRIINSGTGRGSIGVLEPAAPKINTFIFSMKLAKGTFDVLTGHLFDAKVRADPFARKQAAYRILNMAATYYGLTAIYEALNPGSTEPDPRGSHFGEVKMGSSWVNIIGPFRPMARTLATIIPTFHKGEFGFWRTDTKGNWQGIKLFPTKATKYGAFTPLDLLEGFVERKASPLFGTVLNHWRGKDFLNRLPTPTGDIENLFGPITIKNYFEDKANPNVDYIIINTLLNVIGVNTNTPTPKK